MRRASSLTGASLAIRLRGRAGERAVCNGAWTLRGKLRVWDGKAAQPAVPRVVQRSANARGPHEPGELGEVRVGVLPGGLDTCGPLDVSARRPTEQRLLMGRRQPPVEAKPRRLQVRPAGRWRRADPRPRRLRDRPAQCGAGRRDRRSAGTATPTIFYPEPGRREGIVSGGRQDDGHDDTSCTDRGCRRLRAGGRGCAEGRGRLLRGRHLVP